MYVKLSPLEREAIARSHVRSGLIKMGRASRNWVRDLPGDEEVARAYWLSAELDYDRARSYVSSEVFDRLRDEIRAERRAAAAYVEACSP